MLSKATHVEKCVATVIHHKNDTWQKTQKHTHKNLLRHRFYDLIDDDNDDAFFTHILPTSGTDSTVLSASISKSISAARQPETAADYRQT